jgi:predicted CoA-binding protein
LRCFHAVLPHQPKLLAAAPPQELQSSPQNQQRINAHSVGAGDGIVRHDSYDDSYIKRILADTRTIAMVGASTNWNRPSYFAMKYLQAKGFRVIPVNPRSAGESLLGETVLAGLADIESPVDMVDIFRNSDAAGPITDEAIAIGAKIVWMQFTVVNPDAADRAEAAGLRVVMNRCPKVEYARLNGELSWNGFNSRVISSKRRRLRG